MHSFSAIVKKIGSTLDLELNDPQCLFPWRHTEHSLKLFIYRALTQQPDAKALLFKNQSNKYAKAKLATVKDPGVAGSTYVNSIDPWCVNRISGKKTLCFKTPKG